MSNIDEMRMDKSYFSVATLEDESDEVEYWLTQTPQARLEALELLRQIAYGYDPETTRMERTCVSFSRTQALREDGER